MSTNAHHLFSILFQVSRCLFVAIIFANGLAASSARGEDVDDEDPPPAYPPLVRPLNSASRQPANANEPRRPEAYPNRQASANSVRGGTVVANRSMQGGPPNGTAYYPSGDEGIAHYESDQYAAAPGSADWLDNADYCSNGMCCGRLWVRPEFVLWWVQGFPVPPLVTTSPTGTAQSVAGELGQATTTTLFGGEDINNSVRPGGRIRLGYWLDSCQTHGIDVSYLGLATRETNYAAASSGSPILARPFFNVEPGFVGQDTEFVAFPGLLQGGVQVVSNTSFETIEVLYRHAWLRTDCDSIDFLVGWRFNRLTDQLSISDSKTSIGTGSGIAVGTTIQEIDSFNTRNVFNGVEFGLTREKYCGCWSLELATKIALGMTNVRTALNGQTTVTVPVPGAAPDVSVTPTGLLVQQTNSGVRDSEVFSVIPEIGAVIGYGITENLRATVGYTFMYWTSVARAGNQIDTQLNLSQLTPAGLTGSAHPAYLSNTTGVWAQGFNFGLHYQF